MHASHCNSATEDDYYAFLNVPKNASGDQIVSSYRRLSRLFHPDKHQDEKLKRDAEVLFNKAKKAYEVLSDPHKRAIYDTVGLKGLEVEGWQIIQRTKTPQEIREEFEKLEKEKEERYLRLRTNPKGAIIVGINATDLFEKNVDYVSYNVFGLPNLEVNSISVRQSIDLPLDTNATSSLSANLDVSNGKGSGTIVGGFRRVFSPQTWGEAELAVGQGPIISFKLFRTISRRSFFTTSGFIHFSDGRIKPGIDFVIARHLTKQTIGYLTWRPFPQSFMNTAIAWNSSKYQILSQLQVGVPNCFAVISCTRAFENNTKIRASFRGGTFGASLECGFDSKVSEHTLVGASMIVGVPKGVTLKLKLNRANQTYVFSVLLADEIVPEAIFYGTVLPLLSYYCVKKYIIDPYTEREKNKKNQEERQENSARLAALKKEAEAAICLMTESYNRIKEQEMAKSGLVVVKALYGKSDIVQSYINCDDISPFVEVLLVSIPVQCLVKDSSLSLTEASKSNLPGFYDPCFGEPKILFVRYQYKGRIHESIFRDDEKVTIPSNVTNHAFPRSVIQKLWKRFKMNLKNYTDSGKRISKALICDLHLAISLNNVKEAEKVILKLIKYDPEFDVNCITLIGNATPLSFAIYRSHADIVKLLLKYRCNPNLVSKDHLSRLEPPLCSAVRIGNVAIVETLLQWTTGLNVNQTDFFNQTPLWLAVKGRRLDFVEMIVTNERFTLDCDSFKFRKSSPVYLAAKYLNQGRRKIFDLLVDYGLPLAFNEDTFDESVTYWISVVHNDDYFTRKLINAGLQPKPSEICADILKTMLPLSLKSIVCIFLRRKIIDKTNRPVTLPNVSRLFPEMPRILIDNIVHLT